jgi:exodeoxyribonuclease VII large subunit
VQGEAAPASICESLRLANSDPRVDLVIFGRGGGSIEDLWAFNDETVARAVFASSKPTISAVGHETDFTIADFVADLRAPTPSAAAELAVPDSRELAGGVDALGRRMLTTLEHRLASARQQFSRLAEHPLLKRPEAYVEVRAQRVDEASERIVELMHRRLERQGSRVDKADASLRALSPRGVLSRGYAMLVDAADGHVVQSTRQAEIGQALHAHVSDGVIGARVMELRPSEDG